VFRIIGFFIKIQYIFHVPYAIADHLSNTPTSL
jgi:hypothetical protein